MLLREVLPGIHVFLAEDDLLDTRDLERYVEASHVIVVFVSRGYFQSKRCTRELRAAAEQQKKIVLVCETLLERGAVSLPGELQRGAGRDRALYEYLAPAAKRRIEWQHAKPFLEVALTELAKEIIDEAGVKLATHDPLVLMGSVVQKTKVRLPRVVAGTAHVYVSAHNEGAMAFVLHEIQSQPGLRRTPLRVSQSPEEAHVGTRRKSARPPRGLCREPAACSSVFLLYLDRRLWGSAQGSSTQGRALQAAQRAAIARDVAMAMDQQMHVMLVHERDGPHAAPFSTFLEGAPAPLVEWGLFADGAIAMHAGIYRPVAVHLAAAELADLLTQEPKEWRAARIAGGAVWSLEEREGMEEEAKVAPVAAAAPQHPVGSAPQHPVGLAGGEAAASGAAAADGSTPSFRLYMEEGIIISGVDDMAGMAVNPVHLERMQMRQQEPRKTTKLARNGDGHLAGEAASAARQPRRCAWTRLGISVESRTGDSAGVVQLRKLEKFLALEQGAILPTEAEEVAAQEHDLAAPERAEAVLRSSTQARRGRGSVVDPVFI